MERTSGLPWGGSALMLLCLVSMLGLKDVTSQPLQCFSCTDRGDGGCLPENAANVSCTEDHNVCVETISAIRTSHDVHIILKKGCGYGVAAKLDRTISFHGISIFIQLSQCNCSLCNSHMDLKHYQLAPEDNVTHIPNDEQCYSCIGRPEAECSPSSAPILPCYNTYSHCFDGNLTISIDNDTTVVPVKSCAMRYRCAVQTVTYGSASYEIKGACCSGEICNKDLANSTQLDGLPYLVLLNNNVDEPTTAAAPPPWLTPTHTVPTTRGAVPGYGGETQPAPNSTATARSSYQGGPTSNAAPGLVYSTWLILLLMRLS